MESFINRKCIGFIFAIGPNNFCKSLLKPKPLLQIKINLKTKDCKTCPVLTLIRTKSSSYKISPTDKYVLRSSTLSKVSSRCIVKYNKGNSQVSLIGNTESSEKNLSSYEAPLVHHASSGCVVDLQKSFLDNRLKDRDKSSGSLDVILNELELLTETKRSCINLYAEKNSKNVTTEADLIANQKTESLIPEVSKYVGLSKNKIFFRNLPKYYASLAKSRLTGLVVLTSMAGYAIAPAPFDPTVFIACSLGTALTSSSANSINQFFEIPFDSQMKRTKNRVLVRGLLTPLHAITFGAVCGGIGIASLYFGVNELTAVLGALNLIIYTLIYTPLKQMSIVNTWVGSVVGAIPPMMGWAGCTGSLGPGALIIGGMLYAWQFPHFNALSWNIKHDYERAGYKMMAISHPGLCHRTALRYSASLIVLSTLAPVYDVTTWTFAVESLPLNLYLTYLAWKFYKEADSSSSRKLFRFSLLHLPALLLLMIMSKKEIIDNDPSNNCIHDDYSLPAVPTQS